MADLKSFNPDLLIAAVADAADAGITAIREQAAMLKVAADTVALNGVIAGASAAHLKDFTVRGDPGAFSNTSFAIRGLVGVRDYGYNELELQPTSLNLPPGKYRALLVITKVEEVPE